jgi:hypothetical protein
MTNTDLNLIKGAKSSKPPSIVTRKNEDPSAMSRSPLFSQLHWVLNDMSPRNSPRSTTSPANSPRSYTPTKRGFDAFDKSSPDSSPNDIAPVGTSTFTPSVFTQEDANGNGYGRMVRQKREETMFLSSSLPVHHQPHIYQQIHQLPQQPPTFQFERVLSPPSPSSFNGQQFPLFGMEMNNDLDNSGDAMHFALDLEPDHVQAPNKFATQQYAVAPQKTNQYNGSLPFSLPDFKLSTDSSMVLSEPGMFDFDAL